MNLCCCRAGASLRFTDSGTSTDPTARDGGCSNVVGGLHGGLMGNAFLAYLGQRMLGTPLESPASPLSEEATVAERPGLSGFRDSALPGGGTGAP